MNGELVQEGTWLPVSKVVLPANGTLVLGQDQDETIGGFDATQSFCGEFTDLQVGDLKIPIYFSEHCGPWQRVCSGSDRGNITTNKCKARQTSLTLSF